MKQQLPKHPSVSPLLSVSRCFRALLIATRMELQWRGLHLSKFSSGTIFRQNIWYSHSLLHNSIIVYPCHSQHVAQVAYLWRPLSIRNLIVLLWFTDMCYIIKWTHVAFLSNYSADPEQKHLWHCFGNCYDLMQGILIISMSRSTTMDHRFQ
jgi:hypothetical protein